MKSTKKHYFNIKKLAIITLIAILLFSLIGVFRVYATGDTFIITNAEVSEKSNTIDVKELSFEKTEVNSNIIYHKVGDYVKYKITVQNNDSQSYKVVSVSDNNENEFITYDYSDFEGKELKANETADLYVSVKYLKELEDVTKRTQEMNVEINVTLEDYDGNVVTEDIKINSNSPKTGDPITIYMTTAFISAVGLIILVTTGKKGKTSKRGKRFYVIILALVLLTPVTVKAAGNVLTLNFKSVFELNDKVVVKYTNTLTGEEEQKIIEYNEKLPIPDDLEKEGYEFTGWFDENGNKVTEDTIITEDTLLEGKFKPIEYTITYNLDYGMVESENPLKYTIESNDITINNPTRTGYTFEGWTGTDLEQKTKDVKIEKGSIGNREYTANWKVVDYTITYKGLTDAEKTELNNPISFNIETPSTTLNNPQNRKDADGDTTERFVGWKENETTSTNITIPAELENKEYEAVWVAVSPNTYTITYDLDGGSLTTANKTSFTKLDEFTLNNPTKTGYTFIGWTGSNGTTPEKEVTIPTGTRKDLSYTANWTKDIYTISYNLKGGTVATTNPSEYTVTSDNITLNNPTKNGYEFAGWTGTDLNSETTSVTISTGSTGNREYTANWTPIEYTITYVLDGGTATNPTSYTIESDDITLNNPSKDGYTFKGWSGTELTGNTNTEVTIATGSTGNKEYTANWTKDTYTITYELNGGINASSNPSTYQVDTDTITLAEPTKTGYTFKGWSGTGLTGDTNTEVTIATGSKENKEYTANWEIINYSISYDLDGGTVATTNPSEYTVTSDNITLNNPTKNGYEFAGWTGTGLTGNANTEVTIATGSTGDRSYTANWEESKIGKSISTTISYIGQYADINGDGTIDGIIYADLLDSEHLNGTWYNDSNTTFSITTDVTASNVKDYVISQENITDNRWNSTETKDVIKLATNQAEGRTKERFYIMGLDDNITDQKINWYNGASRFEFYTNISKNAPNVTSVNFGKGRENTLQMKQLWNTERYGEKATNDVWGYLPPSDYPKAGPDPITAANDSEQYRWFLPSRGEWGAFLYNLNISKTASDPTYLGNYGFEGRWYLSSSKGTAYQYSVWYTRFHNPIGIYDGMGASYVRVSATF